MYAGEGDGGQNAPPLHIALDVTFEEPSPDEVAFARDRQRALRSRLPSPATTNEVPFKTTRGFGNWLVDHMDLKGFRLLYMRLTRFAYNNNMRQLVRFGKLKFRDMQRLYFFQGLHLIATTKKQKEYIKRLFQKEREQMQMRMGATSNN